jgi:site-specific recombinase XerD
MSKNETSSEKTYSLSQCIDYYELCNKSEGKSPKTVGWYTDNLHRFCRYMDHRHLPDSIDIVDIKLLREYVLDLMKKTRFSDHPYTPAKPEPLSTATIHAHVRTLRAFFSWLVREGLIKDNYARDLKPPKLSKKVISTLSDEEILSILKTFKPTNHSDARNQTIFMLLLDTGLRIGEVINLKMEDVYMSNGFLKVLGKGNKERVVPIGCNAQKALQRYLFRYRSRPANSEINRVFLSIHGFPLTENSMKLMFARLAQISGVQRLHSHLCRHTFATRFLINGGDVFALQQILGHSSLEMVRHYVNLASSYVAIQHQKYSPLDHINLQK